MRVRHSNSGELDKIMNYGAPSDKCYKGPFTPRCDHSGTMTEESRVAIDVKCAMRRRVETLFKALCTREESEADAGGR